MHLSIPNDSHEFSADGKRIGGRVRRRHSNLF